MKASEEEEEVSLNPHVLSHLLSTSLFPSLSISLSLSLVPETAVTNSFSSLPRFRIYSCYVALSSRNYVPRRLNSRQLLARSSLISLEIKDDNDDGGNDEDDGDAATGETQYQREERDTNLTISTGTKAPPLGPLRCSLTGLPRRRRRRASRCHSHQRYHGPQTSNWQARIARVSMETRPVLTATLVI